MTNAKYTLLLMYLCFIVGCKSYDAKFCSDVSTAGLFGTQDKALTLDGSDNTVSSYVGDDFRSSCTCSITTYSGVDKFRVVLEYSTTLIKVTCSKRLDIIHGGYNDTVPTFGCASDSADVNGIDVGGELQLVLNMFDSKTRGDDTYRLTIETVPDSKLAVKCSSPVQNIQSTTVQSIESTTVQSIDSVTLQSIHSTTVYPMPSLSSTNSTVKAFRVPQSSDTMVIVGVVVGLGLFFLFFISCLLLYIIRRNKRRGSSTDQITPNKEVYNQTRLQRTLTHFYAKLKMTRPLPKIPEPSSSITSKKPLEAIESGHYASIRSNGYNDVKHSVHKQQSLQSTQSDTSYMEPVVLSVNELATSCDKLSSKSNIKHPAVTKEASVESTDSYIKPVSGNGSRESGKEPENTCYMNEDSPDYIHPACIESVDKHEINKKSHEHADKMHKDEDYINIDSLQKPFEESLALNNKDDNIDSDEKFSDKSKNTDSETAIQNFNNTIYNTKSPITGTDSTGYITMSAKEKIQAKRQLKPEDSTFPNLITFSPLASDSVVKKEIASYNKEEKEVNVVNKKLKRYVRCPEETKQA